MTRVLLVYPYFRAKHDRSIFRFPPLGVGYVAASLKEAGYDVQILDCTFMKKAEALEKAFESRADVVGIYSMVSMKADSLWLASRMRDHCRLLVAGGPLPSCDPAAFASHFDLVVRGEGETAILEILRISENGGDFRSVRGLAFHKNSRIWPNDGFLDRFNDNLIINESRELYPDLDSISFPARKLLPNRDYIDYWKRKFGHATTTVFTTRGCPFSCDFCSNAVFGVSYRERSAENVVDEVEQALSFGYNHVHFADDVFTLNKDRVAEICHGIRRRGLSLTWECLARVDSLDRGLAALMKASGCRRIFFGIESGNDTVLKLMNKKITVAKARQAVQTVQSAGITVGAFFILCYPGETNETVLNTIRFATSLPVDYLSFTVPYPLPGTPLYERVRKNISKEWKPAKGLLSDHVLIYRSEFSETKMRFGILKGQAQHWLRKRLGKSGSILLAPFARLTDYLFKIMR